MKNIPQCSVSSTFFSFHSIVGMGSATVSASRPEENFCTNVGHGCQWGRRYWFQLQTRLGFIRQRRCGMTNTLMVSTSYTVKIFVVPLLTQLLKMLKWEDFKFTFSIKKELKKTVKVTMLKNQNDRYFCCSWQHFSFKQVLELHLQVLCSVED